MSQTQQRKYPSRARRTPQNKSQNSKDAADQALLNGETEKRSAKAKPIPALTTSRVFGTNSPVADRDVNIQAFLAKCMSQWDTYTLDEKQSINTSLPTTRQKMYDDVSGTQTPPLLPDFCSKDPYLKSAAARFKRDLADGYYQKSWQDKAKRAHAERLDGKFDGYLTAHTEEMFVEDGSEEEDGSARDELIQEDGDGEYADSQAQGRRGRKAVKRS